MGKVTYLLGAGASSQALPVVKHFPDAISGLQNWLTEPDRLPDEGENYLTGNTSMPTQPKKKVLDYFLRDLLWLSQQARENASIDTYAKKLALQHNAVKLNRLKTTLSAVLVLLQYRNPIDKRYDQFLSAILEDVRFFPKQIKVITWNYDYQIEKAYSEYLGVTQLRALESQIGSTHKYSSDAFGSKGEEPSIFKLNGTAGISSEGSFKDIYFYPDLNVRDERTFIQEVLRNYYEVEDGPSQNMYTTKLSFAWEGESGEYIKRAAIEATRDTDCLVVIGYSFPFFNRKIDREILGKMISLKRIYIQDLYPDNIVARFRSILPDFDGNNIEAINDVNQFFLPPEI